jgi:glycolate oxidase iron-sulfur subunit
VVLPHPLLLRTAAFFQPLARPLLPARVRALVPRTGAPLRRLPRQTDPPEGAALRGTVALLSGCVQDRWFHRVNLATIRVLARNGWRVTVPRGQRCCGALAAHNGRPGTARRLAERNERAFAGADRVVVNAAGCSAHMKSDQSLPVRDLMEFLEEEGLTQAPGRLEPVRVAYHDACHALRAQHIREQPRSLLEAIEGVELVEVENGDRCCGAAGIYNITEPVMSRRLMLEKAEAIAATGARIVASANPGCTMQIAAGLRHMSEGAKAIEIVHPVELLDRAYR